MPNKTSGSTISGSGWTGTVPHLEGEEATMSEHPNQHADDSIHGGTGAQAIIQVTGENFRSFFMFMGCITVILVGMAYFVASAVINANDAKMTAQLAYTASVRAQAEMEAHGIHTPPIQPRR